MKNSIDTKQKRLILLAALSEFPDTPKLTIAKILYKRHPELWSSVESCRDAVRFKTGAKDEQSRRLKGNAGTMRPLGSQGDFVWRFPQTKAEGRRPFDLDSRRTLVLPDIHVPFHDTKAVQAAVEFGVRAKVDCILLNGDIVDFFSISRFDKDISVTKLTEEISLARQFLGWLRQKFPKARIIFKEGNHDERFCHYICSKAPELLGIRSITLQQLLTAENVLESKEGEEEPEINGIEWVKDKRVIRIGHLDVYHGHEFGKSSIAPPVNPARGTFLRTMECTLSSHLHKSIQHEVTTSKSKLIACWSTGCLCGLWPDYAQVNQWTHGAAMVELHREANFTVTPIRILDGKVL